MRVALFTHHFLEPTHHAIAQLLGALRDCDVIVYAKRFEHHFQPENIRGRIPYIKGRVPGMEPKAFDVAHAIYDGKTAFRAYYAALDAKIPFILSYHGGFDVHAKIHDSRYRDQSRIVTEGAAAVTVPCMQDIDRLRAIGVARPIEVLPVPVVVPPGFVSRQADPKRLVLVGRLVPKKGVDVALRAMCHLPEYFLHVVGDGELREQLEGLARDLGVRSRVTFLGLLPFDAMLAEVASAFALLHPARVASDGNAEGTPQVVLLAQAIGVPVIASRSGSLGEIVEHANTGLLILADDERGLAASVHLLGKNDTLRARLNRPASHEERTLERVASKLRGIYDNVCAGC